MRKPYAVVPIGVLLVFVGFTIYVMWSIANLRGPEQWQAVLADLRARGEPADFQALIPPPIPDIDNLAAIPLFALERDPSSPENFGSVKLDAALSKLGTTEIADVTRTSWVGGESADPVAFAKALAKTYHAAFRDRPTPATGLETIDVLCPAINELRKAATTRKRCRFNADYTSEPPWNRPLGPLTTMLTLGRFLKLHAVMALQSNQPTVALDDFKLGMKLDEGLRQQPILVSGLIAIALSDSTLNAVWEGLESHKWNDAQLAQIQRELAPVDFLFDYHTSIRGEALGYFAPTFDSMRDDPAVFHAAAYIGTNPPDDDDYIRKFLINAVWSTVPRGSWDATKARGVELYMRAARVEIDPIARRVYPAQSKAIEYEADHLEIYSLPDVFLHLAAGPVLSSASHFGLGQFHVDAARVACMIERYRLAHGTLPASLADLRPYDDGAGIPHDICNGEPLHYELRPDGTYLLYSVGWNEVDDGGTAVYTSGPFKRADEKSGDWVWPQPGHPGT